MKKGALSGVNLNLLVQLEALLSKRSVTEAARAAGVTPSAMSHALAELRRLLDDPLLVRSGRGMVLSPRAETLAEPLRKLLLDANRLLAGSSRFEPLETTRRFVIAAPDFLGTVVLSELVQLAAREAPKVSFDLVPSARRGSAWQLETGEVDLTLGAVVDDAPGIHRTHLFTERFVCAARRGHPALRRGTLDLEAYVTTPHLVITLGDDSRPTWVDEMLAKLGKARTVTVRTRYFMAAPLLLATTDLITTGPHQLLAHFAKLVPLQVAEAPIRLPTYSEQALWHERFEEDAAHRWLRERVVQATRQMGTGRKPERTRWKS